MQTLAPQPAVTAPAQRKGDWICTYSNIHVYPLDARPDEIVIEDIAHALSLICRFTGHCREFYSVAQHCCLAASYAPEGYRLWALLHDASEAYLTDISRPVKRYMADYKAYEAALEKVIADKFGLCWPMPSVVKAIDNQLLLTEARDLMPPGSVSSWNLGGEPFANTVQPWTPAVAEERFLTLFYNLTK